MNKWLNKYPGGGDLDRQPVEKITPIAPKAISVPRSEYHNNLGWNSNLNAYTYPTGINSEGEMSPFVRLPEAVVESGMRGENISKDIRSAAGSLLNAGAEFSGVLPAARTYERLRDNPKQLGLDVTNTLGDAVTLPLYMQGYNYNPLTGQPYGQGFDATMDAVGTAGMFTPLIGRGVNIGTKGTKAAIQYLTTKTPSKNAYKTIFKSILDNPKEISSATRYVPLSNDEIVKLEKYLDETYNFKNLTPYQRNQLIDRETAYLKKSGVSIDQRIANDKKLLNNWEKYKQDRIDYFNSSKFEERVKKQYGEYATPEMIESLKTDALKNLEKRPYIRPDIIDDDAAAHYKPYTGREGRNFGISEHKPGYSYFKDDHIDETTVFHEGRHQLLNAKDKEYMFPSTDEITSKLRSKHLLYFDDYLKPKDPLTKSNIIGDFNYYLNPEEFTVKMDELRRDLSKIGYDYKTQDLTKKHLKKFRGLTNRELLNKVNSNAKKFDDLTLSEKTKFWELYDSQNIAKTQYSKKMLDWFDDDALLHFLNNYWATLPAVGAGAATVAAKQVESPPFKAGGWLNKYY